MTDCIRLYSDPTALACAIAISGTIDPFRVGSSYEGRLDVTGQHGEVSIVSWDGDLPNGAAVAFDAVHSQIVVTWPAAADQPARFITIDAENKGFENGAAGWDFGSGISVTQGGPPYPPPWDTGSTKYAQYLDQTGNSEVVSQTFVPVAKPGQSVTASCAVYQGSSSKGHAAGAVRLKWYDKRKNYLGSSTGNWVTSNTDSVGHTEWHGSHVTASAAENAKYMKLAGVFDRSRENKALWIDTFEWDGAYTYFADPDLIGHDNEDPIHLIITIRDERGCRATWTGEIRDYAVYPTSALYPLFTQEKVDTRAAGVQQLHSFYSPQPVHETAATGASGVQAFTRVVTTRYISFSATEKATTQAAGVQAFTRKATTAYKSFSATESAQTSATGVQLFTREVTTRYTSYDYADKATTKAEGVQLFTRTT